MKICLINNLYKPFSRGGAERVVEIMAEKLSQQGHDIFIIATKPKFKKLPTDDKNIKNYYLDSFYYYLDKIPKFLRLFWHLTDIINLVNYYKIKKILQKDKPELAITHNLTGISFIIPRALKKLNIRHFHYLHDLQLLHPSGLLLVHKEKKVDSLAAKIYQSIIRWLFASPEKIISPSAWLLKMHTDRKFFIRSKKIVLPNPLVDVKNLARDKKTGKEFTFLYLSQVEEYKGIYLLIEAFKKLKVKKCKLLVINNGSALKRAKILAAGEKRIKFLGRQNRGEINKFLANADCLIVPSLCYENSPVVIYEALAVGLPVIAPASGGISELLGNNSELLFKPGDEEDLLKKLDWAIKNVNALDEIAKNQINRANILVKIDYDSLFLK